MNIATRDKSGNLIPANYRNDLFDPRAKPIIRLRINLNGDGTTYVSVDSSRIVGFSLEDSRTGQSGRACSNTATITLDNYDKIFSSQRFNDVYNPSVLKYNGPAQGDGRGNLRPWRAVTVDFSTTQNPMIECPLIYGMIDGKGFQEKIGADNENYVVVKINDLAKKLIDNKKPLGSTTVGGQEIDVERGVAGKKICDPADTANSIVHILAALGGIPAADVLAPQTIPVVVDYFKIEKDVWSELSELADSVLGSVFFYGKKLYFGDSPLFAGAENNSAASFTNDHYSSLSLSENHDSIKNKIKMVFGSYQKLQSQTIWVFEGTNPVTGFLETAHAFVPGGEDDRALWDHNSVFKAKYQLFDTTPVVTTGRTPTSDPSQRSSPSTEVVKADNVSLVTNVAGKVEIFDTSTLEDSAIIRFSDTGSSFLITQFKIVGEPYVKSEANTALFQDLDSITLYGVKDDSFENKFVTKKTFQAVGEASARQHFRILGDALIGRKRKPNLSVSFSVGYPDLMLRSGMFCSVLENKQAGDGSTLLNKVFVIERVSVAMESDSWRLSLSCSEYVDSWSINTASGVITSSFQQAIPIGRSITLTQTWYKRGAVAPTAPTVYPPTSQGWSATIPSGTDTLWTVKIDVRADGTPVG